MKLYPALKAIVERDGKFLLLKRSEAEDVRKGEWDIPGGAIEFGEDPIEALRREVKEECGIEVEVLKPLRVWSFFKDSNTQVFGVTMLCKYKSGEVRLGKEHVDFRWISKNEIYGFEVHKGIVEDFESI